MANMSYCRFQNTVSDLADCLHAMQEAQYEGDDMSPEEINARKHLIEMCKEIAENGDEMVAGWKACQDEANEVVGDDNDEPVRGLDRYSDVEVKDIADND